MTIVNDIVAAEPAETRPHAPRFTAKVRRGLWLLREQWQSAADDSAPPLSRVLAKLRAPQAADLNAALAWLDANAVDPAAPHPTRRPAGHPTGQPNPAEADAALASAIADADARISTAAAADGGDADAAAQHVSETIADEHDDRDQQAAEYTESPAGRAALDRWCERNCD